MTTVSARLPFEYYVLDRVVFEGGIVGRIAGKLVRERVKDSHGRSYRFVGVALRDSNGRLDVARLKSDEWVVAPNLVYAFEAPGAEDVD